MDFFGASRRRLDIAATPTVARAAPIAAETGEAVAPSVQTAAAPAAPTVSAAGHDIALTASASSVSAESLAVGKRISTS